MKFLYVSFVSDSEQMSGILKKVIGQTKGVSLLGHDAYYTTVEKDAVVLHTPNGIQKKAIPQNLRWRAQQKAIAAVIGAFIHEGQYDTIYIKGFLISRYLYQIAKAAKKYKADATVIFEVATYPYWDEYRRLLAADKTHKNIRSFLGHLLEIMQHARSSLFIRHFIDAVVVFGAPVQRLWGVPAQVIDNGVDVASIPLRTPQNVPSAVRILGVVGTSILHGFERVLDGMKSYYDAGGQREFIFSIAGNNDTLDVLRQSAKSPMLCDRVRFLGYQNADQLAELYRENDLAVSILGYYGKESAFLSPLKSREYCAAGIPFIYSYNDQLLDNGVPFAKRICNDTSALAMDEIADFVDRCRADADLPQKERAFAIEHYDWRVIMQQVLQFAESQQKR